MSKWLFRLAPVVLPWAWKKYRGRRQGAPQG